CRRLRVEASLRQSTRDVGAGGMDLFGERFMTSSLAAAGLLWTIERFPRRDRARAGRVLGKRRTYAVDRRSPETRRRARRGEVPARAVLRRVGGRPRRGRRGRSPRRSPN